jgi:hypothetical protein
VGGNETGLWLWIVECGRLHIVAVRGLRALAAAAEEEGSGGRWPVAAAHSKRGFADGGGETEGDSNLIILGIAKRNTAGKGASGAGVGGGCCTGDRGRGRLGSEEQCGRSAIQTRIL